MERGSDAFHEGRDGEAGERFGGGLSVRGVGNAAGWRLRRFALGTRKPGASTLAPCSAAARSTRGLGHGALGKEVTKKKEVDKLVNVYGVVFILETKATAPAALKWASKLLPTHHVVASAGGASKAGGVFTFVAKRMLEHVHAEFSTRFLVEGGGGGGHGGKHQADVRRADVLCRRPQFWDHPERRQEDQTAVPSHRSLSRRAKLQCRVGCSVGRLRIPRGCG